MITGILWALLAGIMLGLYALPKKFVEGYKDENTWGLFFLLALLVLPFITAFGLINNFCEVLSAIPTDSLWIMVFASILWGMGVQMWTKAIDYIGVSLGFSIFIGTVIMIGSLLPFFVDGLPPSESLMYIAGGLAVTLLGIIANGRAGILRTQAETADNQAATTDSKHMVKGITIALVGGIFATGFSLANAVGVAPITEAITAQGNPVWTSSIAIMFIIYVVAAVYVLPFFAYQLTVQKAWGNFAAVPFFGKNFWLILTMAFFNFAASALFAYAAFSLGDTGNTVGYAIYNTASVLLAVVGGIVAKEWISAPSKAKSYLYCALISMILGVVLIAMGNSI